ncbi:MAG: endolytic transglycosylase MltG [Acinetobacter sp.]|nr:endolytic transglycosylase MltG [Acinetobacter sp.]
MAKKTRSSYLRRAFYLLSFLILVLAYRTLVQSLALPVEGLRFKVERGSNWHQVADRLTEKDLITHPITLRAWLWLRPQEAILRPGTFTLKPPMTLEQLVVRLAGVPDGNPPLRIIEGQRFSDLRRQLAEREDIVQTITDMDDAEIMRAIGASESHPEGWFAPDTYDIAEGERDIAVLRRLYLRQKNILATEWAKRAKDLPYKTPYEALIMASIIEKETGIADERHRVSGVFVRRLNIGMRLQTDPTVIYGVSDSFQGRILRSHLRDDNPYNTYRIHGLPPTPIALPGRASIHAALHPADGDALFFVANDKGEHIFSATYEEHKKAVQRYQR